MRKEDYVTKECARLAQQKGFPLRKVYKDNGDRPLFYDLPKEHPDWMYCDAWYYPTLWEVQQWLRETKGMHVVVSPIFDEAKTSYIASLFSLEADYLTFAEDTYENSLQTGIMKALEILKE